MCAFGPAGRRAGGGPARARAILLAKIYRKPIPAAALARYRKYVSSHPIRSKAHLIRQMRGRKHLHSPSGSAYDLEEVFEDLNRRFFHGLMARPRLTWSRSHSRNRLGHYDPAHNAIVISRAFDDKRRSALCRGIHRVSRDAAPEASREVEGQPEVRALAGVPGGREAVSGVAGGAWVLETTLVFRGRTSSTQILRSLTPQRQKSALRGPKHASVRDDAI